ncbi:MAG TPA: PIN domain-containing protein [Chloroflexia bacterium]|nr:PIN domain-containing protein [Chloroflexia bacterium]
MPRSIFVNTSGWLALYNPNDPNHAAATDLWKDLRDQPIRLVTTDYVLDQTFTALKVFGSLQTAQAFNQLVQNSSLIRLFLVDSVIFDRAWRVFVEDEQPQWTFTDCINYAVVQYLGVNEVFTFDPGFSTPGMVVIPSSGQ